MPSTRLHQERTAGGGPSGTLLSLLALTRTPLLR